ncbi:unnamed protein product [Arctia plantaginis]|uniref:Uncharacterized protein n=1 Tax=Arctia plantaginis TaxID=874455 RepID=A0A8S1B9P3_ARCPL|nr:unnamed protein product [Arctia plantaginis]
MFWLLTTFMFFSGTSYVCSTAITPEVVQAMKTIIDPVMKECQQELGLTEEKLQDLKDKGEVEDKVFCLSGCVFKKLGIFDKNVMVDVEKASEFHKAYIKDEAALAEMEKVTKECSKVNEESVSDGDKGCDRAKLFIKCVKEHKQTTVV